MIKEKINEETGEKIYLYSEPDINKKQLFQNTILNSFVNYAEANELDIDKIEINSKLLNEIFIRIDKRKDYYIIFHKETHINEAREAALVAFWILKFKPFMLISDDGIDYNLNINCGFAAYFIFSAVSESIDRISGGTKKIFVNEEYFKKILYAFKYWDLSKESMMLLAETLCCCEVDV